jgi:predicted ribosome quality control (RQC) complex YloA/Tae2 family protein|tara:strand:- start:19415 stop:19690 length:276 start_codon:yes stop_codon:yes gene_type:complete
MSEKRIKSKHDHYDVVEKWEDLKDQLELMDGFLAEFFSYKRNISAGERARRLTRFAKKSMHEIQELILKQEKEFLEERKEERLLKGNYDNE